MEKLKVIKAFVKTAISVGVGAIVGNTIKESTPDDSGTLKKVFIGAGALFLGGFIVDKVSEHYEKQIDDVAEKIKVTDEKKEEIPTGEA